ncbi:MAG: DNA mismatch repair protein MutS [Parasporobacterium sp.]|nr:DNA mismatch repair protein MutS [Parasporobacterium sp.]
MMSQYLETKKQYNDCILFYRLGDFYEMFFDDALTASKALEITLTGKDCGLEERAPMCGVPFHAVDTYLNRLVSLGYKVAIAEQVEDPRLAKGLVKREVIKVVTPGTNINNLALDESKNNYLMCIYYAADYYAAALVDISTGDFLTTQVESASVLMDEINKFSVAEIISNQSFLMAPVDHDYLKDKLGITCYTISDSYFEEETCAEIIKKHFNVIDISGLGLNEYSGSVLCVGALLKYLYETQKTSLEFLNRIQTYSASKYMIIDHSTRRNLELVETMREKNKKGSLLWVLDKTKTAMGARLLRSFIEQPLIDADEINRRQDAIEELNSMLIDRDEIREYLNPIYDLERLMARISYKSASPRDLIAFKKSLEMIPFIKRILSSFHSSLLTQIYTDMDPLEDIFDLIDRAIDENAPVTIKEGGIIRSGYSEKIDMLRNSKVEGKSWLAELEEKEREATDIKSLKIRYNKVFGYYIEVTNTFKDKVPDRYMRKQTLVNAERYITDELKELEDIILGAEEKLFSLEYDIFTEIRETVASQVSRIQMTARAVSAIDAFCSLAYVAERNRYVRPHINSKGIVDIRNGRHPVVETMMEEGRFIPNDTFADQDDNRVSIITGPNMAGKSTYMRQLALIVLMACTGSFVPAEEANISTCDRIFTRVGASDDLASGQSTFMVEMTEVSNILRNATASSLIILDEIGRGTSTYDGLSIAWAVVEYIADKNKCGAKTFFSTHYHELTELEGTIDGVKNYCISVMEQGEDIIFLRKIIRGGADKSYGIQVARLAGVPDEITGRANEIVKQLISADIAQAASPDTVKEIIYRPQPSFNIPQDKNGQFVLTTADDIVHKKLKGLNLDRITPLEAINTLYELQQLI